MISIRSVVATNAFPSLLVLLSACANPPTETTPTASARHTLEHRSANVSVEIESRGTVISTLEDASRIRMRLDGIGRDGSMVDVPDGVVARVRDAIENRRPGIVERWTETAQGIEHFVVIDRKPRGEGELQVSLDVEGARVLREDAAGIALLPPHGAVRTYRGLMVLDADGRRLDASMASAAGGIAIRVDDRDARYPVVIDPVIAATVWHWAAPSNVDSGAGAALAAGNVNGDAYDDLIVGAPNYDNAAGAWNYPGAVMIFYGSASGLPATPSLTLEGALYAERFGASVAVCDINGDAIGDVIVGSPGSFVSIFPGAASGPSQASVQKLNVPATNANFGASVACAGNLDNDASSTADLLVGDPSAANGQSNEGLVHVFFGATTGLNGANPSVTLEENVVDGHFGASLAGGRDVDGGGRVDVVVGAPGDVQTSTSNGTVYLYLGGGSTLDPTNDFSTQGPAQGAALFGASVALADLNGDGPADIVVGSPEWDPTTSKLSAGRVEVFHGVPGSVPNPTSDFFLAGSNAGDRFGFAVACAGNVGGDAAEDLLVGAPYAMETQSKEGSVSLYLGGSAGLNLNPSATYFSGVDLSYLGASLVGRVDFGGYVDSDFAIGAEGNSGSSANIGGTVYAFVEVDPTTVPDGGGLPGPIVARPAGGLCSVGAEGGSSSVVVLMLAVAFVSLRRRRRAPLFAIALAAALASSTANAQAATADDEDIARLHFETGERYYASGRFAEAGEEFTRAYEISHHAELLHNAYVAYRDAGDRVRALASLERYLAVDPGAETPVLRARIEALRADVAAETARTETRSTTQPTAEPAESTEPAARAESVPTDDDHPARARRGGIILLATGAAVGVVGFTAAGVALHALDSRLDSNCGANATPPLPDGQCYGGSSVDAVRSSTPALRGVAYGSLAAGTGLATAGLVRLLRHRGHDDIAPVASAACDRTGCSLIVGGRF